MIEDVLSVLRENGAGHSIGEIIKVLNHPIHEMTGRYGSSPQCPCVSPINKALDTLLREKRIYKIGAYFWKIKS